MGTIIKDTRAQLREERRRNERLAAQLARQDGLLAYVAMMADVDLPEGQEEGAEDAQFC